MIQIDIDADLNRVDDADRNMARLAAITIFRWADKLLGAQRQEHDDVVALEVVRLRDHGAGRWSLSSLMCPVGGSASDAPASI